MRRFRTLCSRTASVSLLVVVWLASARAKAEVTLFDSDGWTFQTTGLVAAHYQLVMGDKDPQGPNGRTLIGGRIYDEGLTGNQETNKITLSDIRSGFIGTQIGFSVNRQLSPTVRVESLLAASVEGINSNRGQDTASPKGVDYREAWAQIVSPYGSLKFGRMFGLFASSSAAVQMMAWQYGVGHPCVIDASTISCGSSGAGPLYPGFDAAIRYTSPRIAGFQLQVSVTDPDVGQPPVGKISPYPRVDADLNYDQTIGPARLRLFAQSMLNYVESNPSPTTIKSYTIWGVMGTGLLDVGPVSLGGGAWTGAGVGERIPLEEADQSNPIAWDKVGNLRRFLGVYGNAQFNFQGTAITVGGGDLLVKLTTYDTDPMMNQSTLVLKDQYEGHIVVTHKFYDVLVLDVEYMHWHTDWQDDPSMVGMPGYAPLEQSLNFMGAGMNYLW
jgi:predicted porin